MFLFDLFDDFKMILAVLLTMAIIAASPFAIAGIIDAFNSDLGPVWTESTNSGFLPDSH